MAHIEKDVAKQLQTSRELSSKMFSKPLYDDKPDKADCDEEPDMTQEEIEREEETEYLATISNFHWFVYPFFKCVERICDRVFGCRKHAMEVADVARKTRDSKRLDDEK